MFNILTGNTHGNHVIRKATLQTIIWTTGAAWYLILQTTVPHLFGN